MASATVKRKRKRSSPSSSGSSSATIPSSSARDAGAARGGNIIGPPNPKGVKRPPRATLKTKASVKVSAPVHRGGGGFRGTFFTASRPKSSRTGRTTQRTASGRTFDQAARERIAAAQAARGGSAATGDVFEILIKTYAEDRRDALADAFIEILIEEIPVGETGVLVDSAHVEDTNETAYTATATVVVDAPYAQYVNDGSDAVEGKLMVWEGDDGPVFATSRVAIPANPFWERALARWSEAVAEVGS